MSGEQELAGVLYESIQITRPLLRHITNAVEAASLKVGVSVGERAVLEVLYNSEDALTAPQMTELLDLKRQFVARVLATSKAKSFVEEKLNPTHKRAHYHQLTEAGRAAIAEICGAELRVLKSLLQRLSADEVIAHLKVQKALLQCFSSFPD
ncbi:MarR family winged helix-turn-helix transcriptional regulator [Pseudovibrio sp. Tun.PSC04-5.I4]|uniref:MarR family winged helix-turn-helix transcriptional regulator n=1 Tax=Pseudovibrio sp. Tun.PSC04-5.I4 TaxID=1798213 RepID=UPI00088B9B4A|nr:MarR family winged helix-turn-helix transcriptional regulator [Pseudovibrio sp. Tun.PSC04-5.I4]SDR39589.1 DNA-binding transcriptional regulator, MarR family [Pseudovibrio sp. Tun.PSC04-5.I4]